MSVDSAEHLNQILEDIEEMNRRPLVGHLTQEKVPMPPKKDRKGVVDFHIYVSKALLQTFFGALSAGIGTIGVERVGDGRNAWPLAILAGIVGLAICIGFAAMTKDDE